MESSDGQLLQQFKKILRMSNRVGLDMVARVLCMTKDELFAKLIDWSEHVPFKIEENVIVVADTTEFLGAIDAQFAAWDKATQTRVEKLDGHFSPTFEKDFNKIENQLDFENERAVMTQA